jgi:hypothetical protein
MLKLNDLRAKQRAQLNIAGPSAAAAVVTANTNLSSASPSSLNDDSIQLAVLQAAQAAAAQHAAGAGDLHFVGHPTTSRKRRGLREFWNQGEIDFLMKQVLENKATTSRPGFRSVLDLGTAQGVWRVARSARQLKSQFHAASASNARQQKRKKKRKFS